MILFRVDSSSKFHSCISTVETKEDKSGEGRGKEGEEERCEGERKTNAKRWENTVKDKIEGETKKI